MAEPKGPRPVPNAADAAWDELLSLRAQAAMLGIKVDESWPIAQLRREIARALAGSDTAVPKLTEKELAAAFTEWDRRYREEPDRFDAEMLLASGTPETYGEAAAPYLLKILAEQSESRRA